MIRRVEYLAHLRHLIANHSFDAHLQSNVCSATALTASAHAYEHVVVLHVEQFDKAAVRGHAGVDHIVKHLLHSRAHSLRRQPLAFGNYRRRIEESANGRAYALAKLSPVFIARLGHGHTVSVKLYFRDARYFKKPVGQVVVLRFFGARENSRTGMNRAINRETANANILLVYFRSYLNVIG